jgi:hypothetical protein
MPHSHDDVKTVLLGSFDPLEVPLVLQLLENEGIFAMSRLRATEPNQTFAYPFLGTGSDEILVEESCLAHARRLIDEELPKVLASLRESDAE